MQKHMIYIANWKMYWTLQQATTFTQRHFDGFQKLTSGSLYTVIICPSFLAISPLTEILKDTNVKIGAQDCSAHHHGAFTGQVLAEDLQSLGAQYCIIGHSERRSLCSESNNEVAKKLQRCIEVNITPILCVGETQADYEAEKTFDVLTQQITSVLEQNSLSAPHQPLFIAYEPVWAIGTGKTPTPEHITSSITFIDKTVKAKFPTSTCKYLYGGSVNIDNIGELKKIPSIDGFLIGGASLNFESLEKIIETESNHTA